MTLVVRNAAIQRDSIDPATGALGLATYAFLGGVAGANWKGRRCRRQAESLLTDVPDESWQASISQNIGASYFVDARPGLANQWISESLKTFATNYFEKLYPVAK